MIGFVQLADMSEKLILLLSQFSYAKKVPFCHFSLDAVDPCMEGKPLHALQWDGDGYKTIELEFPKYIDQITAICGRASRAMYGEARCNWVETHSRILHQKSFHKDQLMKAMILDGLGEYAIPSYPVNDFRDIVNWLGYFSPAIIKPVNGKQGQFVYKLTKSGGAVLAEDQYGTVEFTEEFCLNYFANVEEKFGRRLIIQPFLDFRYDNNRVLDFRLFRQRGADGSWEDVATFGRIGSNAITSNFHTGGSMIEADMALRAIAPEKADALLEEIMMLGERLPLLAEKYYGEDAFCIGFDIAVDRTTLHPYVMESNLTPGLRFIEYQYADHRVNYYKYLLSKG